MCAVANGMLVSLLLLVLMIGLASASGHPMASVFIIMAMGNVMLLFTLRALLMLAVQCGTLLGLTLLLMLV